MEQEGSVTVSVPVKIKPVSSGENNVEVGINFVAERVKDSQSQIIYENQKSIFDQKGKESEGE